MRILLLSMPDSFEHMPAIGIRIPNGALTSLAANLDSHHEVAIADLILVQKTVRETLSRLLLEIAPDVVGLSVMTFQRKTARKIIDLIRKLVPRTVIVAGGYDPSLATEAYTEGVDFVVRGEGEVTFCELIRSLENGHKYSNISGLSYKQGSKFIHNQDRPVSLLSDDKIRPPKREARLLKSYEFLGKQIDVVETSRGCTYDCSFCSIIEMRGRNFHTFSIERVLDDIRDAYRHGARSIFFVDDNIGLNVRRMEALCRAIIDAGLTHIEFLVQSMTSTLANHGETLAPLMKEAGFRYVFLGIENILDEDLQFLRAAAKNYKRQKGKTTGNATIQAIEYLHRNGMYVVGGMIVGTPEDTEESIQANLQFVKEYVDYPYIQHPTPYPRTRMARDYEAQDLIFNRNTEDYDGTTAVVRTKHVSGERLEFLRWRAERWLKMRHAFKTLLRLRPLFLLQHALEMFCFTFRGCTWRTFLGLEPEQHAFARYKELRTLEREYL